MQAMLDADSQKVLCLSEIAFYAAVGMLSRWLYLMDTTICVTACSATQCGVWLLDTDLLS